MYKKISSVFYFGICLFFFPFNASASKKIPPPVHPKPQPATLLKKSLSSLHRSFGSLKTSLSSFSDNLQKLKEELNKLKGRLGLTNTKGYQCYLNSAIQCLASCKPLNNYLTECLNSKENQKKLNGIPIGKKNEEIQKKLEITKQYLDLVHEINNPAATQDSVDNFSTILLDNLLSQGWKTGNMDSQEFLTDKLMKAFGDLQQDKELNNLVGLNTCTTTTCDNKHSSKSKSEPHCPLIVEIQGNTLTDCLNNFFAQSSLLHACTEDNEHEFIEGKDGNLKVDKNNDPICIHDQSYECTSCNRRTSASQQVNIETIPEILCICLKRFDNDGAAISKNEDPITFPLELTLENDWLATALKKNKYTFDLIAFNVHSGGLKGGHYWAYAKDHRNQRWYNLNDKSSDGVKDLKEITDQTQAQLIFYQLRKL